MRELSKTRVTVYSISGQSGYSDEGTLEGFDSVWLKLRKDSGDLLYFPISGVRMVKAKESRPSFVR